MHLKLPTTYIDPHTGAPLPDAILVITDAEFKMRGGSTVLQTAVYSSVAALLAGRAPISQTPKPLAPPEIAAQQPALLAACYTVLSARSEFAGCTVVTP